MWHVAQVLNAWYTVCMFCMCCMLGMAGVAGMCVCDMVVTDVKGVTGVFGIIGIIGIIGLCGPVGVVGVDMAGTDMTGVALLFLVGVACTTASKVASKLQAHAVRLGISLLAGMVPVHTVNDMEGVD